MISREDFLKQNPEIAISQEKRWETVQRIVFAYVEKELKRVRGATISTMNKIKYKEEEIGVSLDELRKLEQIFRDKGYEIKYPPTHTQTIYIKL